MKLGPQLSGDINPKKDSFTRLCEQAAMDVVERWEKGKSWGELGLLIKARVDKWKADNEIEEESFPKGYMTINGALKSAKVDHLMKYQVIKNRLDRGDTSIEHQVYKGNYMITPLEAKRISDIGFRDRKGREIGSDKTIYKRSGGVSMEIEKQITIKDVEKDWKEGGFSKYASV